MSFWQEKITIKNLSLPRFIGGPLDGITDSPFRQLVREFSKEELLYTEMRHVGCVANDKKGRPLKLFQAERPLNYQIAANDIKFIDEAIEKILAIGVDAIDLNVGCPSPAVTKSGSGSALMADLDRLKKIVTHIRSRLSIPFTVKIRSGYKECNALEVAQLLEDCGVDALAIHPRLQKHRFEGRPDYQLVAQIKKVVNIPVIVSGNVINFKTASLAYEQTGVDGFLIGRGLWAKPWKLYEMQCHAQNKPFIVDKKTILRCALHHLDKLLDYYGSRGLYMFRKHIPFYLRGCVDASKFRQELVKSDELDNVKHGLKVCLDNEI